MFLYKSVFIDFSNSELQACDIREKEAGFQRLFLFFCLEIFKC